MSQGQRRLAAIMFTDMVGYTSLGQRNESLSLALVDEQRKIIRPVLAKHGGREVKTIGDAFLVEFPNAIDALRCAYDIQRTIREFNFTLGAEKRIHLRIGVHVGEVMESGGDIAGDAVNVASRIQTLADDGGVAISRQAYDHVQNKFELPFESLGFKALKNLVAPLEVFRMVMPWGSSEGERGARFDPTRIAVLPFSNISSQEEDEYFAEGLTEELISTISTINGLRVIARTSVMGYKGGQKKISEIAKELEVGSILEGSVRRARDRLRVTCQLIDSNTSEHLWAQSYDKELKDVFAIQSEISRTVAESLRVRLSPLEKEVIDRQQTRSPAAHDLYLKGRFALNERTRENVNRALKLFEEALGKDPDFALAYSGLADCYNILSDYNWMSRDKANPLALEFAQRALAIDDLSAEAHASLALSLMKDWRLIEAEKEIRRAIELRPSYAPAYHWYSLILWYLGRVGEAELKSEKGVEIDPNSRVIRMGLANSLYMLGRVDEALQQYQRVVDAYPDFPAVRMWKSGAHGLRGEYDQGVREAEKAAELDDNPTILANLGWAYAVAGRTQEAEKILERLRSLTLEEGGRSSITALVLFGLGRTGETFELFKRCLVERDTVLFIVAIDPAFKRLRTDPRWAPIAKELESFRSSG